MATALTQSQLISHALDRVGNDTLSLEAQDWLNNAIDTLAKTFKFPELEKTTTGSLAGHGSTPPAVADVVNLPADFGDLFDVHSLTLTDSNGNKRTLTPQDTDWYDNITTPLLVGSPNFAIFDLNARTWTPFPLPEQSYTWQLRYRYQPSRLASDITIPFGTDDIFIQAVYVNALQYEDDERYERELFVLNKMVRDYIGGFNKSPIKRKQVRLNANTFKSIQNPR